MRMTAVIIPFKKAFSRGFTHAFRFAQPAFRLVLGAGFHDISPSGSRVAKCCDDIDLFRY